MFLFRTVVLLGTAAVAGVPAAGLSAQGGEASGGPSATGPSWAVTAEVYLWAASLGGTARTGNDFEVDFDELVEDLQLGFMGAVRARHDRWLFVLDGLYVAVGDQQQRPLTARPEAPVLVARYDVDVFVLNALAGRVVASSSDSELRVLAGIRYLQQKNRFVFGRELMPQQSDFSARIWNGVVGLGGRVRLSERIALRAYVDIGTGETDLTWQFAGSLGYQTGRFALRAGYRYLSWNFGRGNEGSRPFDDLDLKGPFFALDYAF